MIPRLEGNIPDMEAHLSMLQAGLDLIDQGFTLFDRELKLVSCNRTFITLLGFPEALMKIGTPFEAFMRYNAERGEYGPGDVETLVAERVRAAAAFAPHYAERVRPNGQVIAIRGEPLPHRGFVTLYTDITAQREAERVIRERNADLEQRVRERTVELETAYERLRAVNQVNQDIAEALRRSEARVRLITDTIPALIGYVDKDWVYQFANRGYADWFGRTKEGMVGQKVSDVLGPELMDEIGPRVARAMRGETVTYEYAMPAEGLHSARGIRHAQSTLVPEVGADGEVLGVFVLSADITDQKKTQATLLQAQKLEAVGQLAGGIAHDLNNMLTVVLGNLSALEERNADTRDAEEFVEPALLATRRCIELIRRLLTFSRQQPLDPSPVDVRALLKSLKSLLHRTLPQSITMFTSFGERLAFAMTDAHQLENALLNLALNARDAMAGGGTLSIHCEQQAINAAQARELELQPGDYICITVIDTGCGMDEQTLLHACEPFFTTKSVGAGSGLGLSMVYGFARQTGGTLRLYSVPGEGSRIALYLPATAAPPASAAIGAPTAKFLDRRQLVLLVEDDSEVRRVVRRQLLELGHTVVEAEDGREALVMLKQIDEIEIVMSDVMMPGEIDGRALAALVQAERPEIKILLISGHGQGSHHGDYQLLAKPFTKSELAAALAGLAR